MPKVIKNGSRNRFFIEQVILRKPCFYYSKSMVLEVPGVPKSMKNPSTNDAKTRFKKAMPKKCKSMSKGSQNGAQNPSKMAQKHPSGAKRAAKWQKRPEKWHAKNEENSHATNNDRCKYFCFFIYQSHSIIMLHLIL